MENVSNIYQSYPISLNQPNFKGNENQPVTKPDMKEDGDKKLNKALIALGAIGAAGVGLCALYKTGKLNLIKGKLGIGIKKAAEETGNSATEKATNAIKHSKAYNADINGYKAMPAKQRAEAAIENIKEGASNNSLKKAGITTNLSHDNKKVIKKVMKDTHSAEMAAKQAARKEAIETAQEVQNVASKAQNSYQALNANQGQAKQIQKQAEKAAETAKQAAEEANKRAEELGTRKARQWATRANNEAMSLEAKAKNVEQQTTKILRGFAQQDNPETVDKFVDHLARMKTGAKVHPNQVLKSLEKNKGNLTPESYSYFKNEIRRLVKQFGK